MPWQRLELAVASAGADALGDALLEAGADSVSVEAPESEPVRLCALVPLGADASALLGQAAAACGLEPAPAFRVSRVEDDDWVRRSQAQFSPLAVGERLWIGASWHAAPGAPVRVVRLDPGMAFGTGSHPSTRLVLQWLEAELRGGERVLDYGCGSGILAIAALALGACGADAVDVDAQALEAAAENARNNGFRLRCLSPDDMPRAERYDVVVSNILAQPLIELAPRLAERTAPGGRIALSGLLETQAAEVAAAYAPWFRTAISRRTEGWALVEGRSR